MLNNTINLNNVRKLKHNEVEFIIPGYEFPTCGAVEFYKLLNEKKITKIIFKYPNKYNNLTKKKFIVTEELKRESNDLVRCIANNSSGKKDNDY